MGLTIFRNLTAWLRGNKGPDEEDDITFERNGNKLLERLTLLGIGNTPIRFFSAKELKKATNNYDERLIIKTEGDYKLYKGLLQDQPISVKKFNTEFLSIDNVIDEIVFTSVSSAHENVLKLLGCCLGTEWPILVFEYAAKGTLQDHLYNFDTLQVQPLPWKCRLSIAVQLSTAVAYLHNEFPNPIVHRDVKSRNILLNESNVAKLSDFSLSVAIPEGEFQVEDKVVGTLGYIAFEYMTTGCFDEKTDVFAVGSVLLELLTGRQVFDLARLANDNDGVLLDFLREYIDNNRLNEIVDPTILEEGTWPWKEQQLQTFARIALNCWQDAHDRPTSNEVASQLHQIFLAS